VAAEHAQICPNHLYVSSKQHQITSNRPKIDRKLIERCPLSQSEKELLVLRDVENLTNGQVAQRLGKDPGTTSGGYTKAKRKFDDWLLNQGPQAQMEQEEGREQAEVFKLLERRVTLPQVAIETGLPAEKVSRYADDYLGLLEKQSQFLRRISEGRESTVGSGPDAGHQEAGSRKTESRPAKGKEGREDVRTTAGLSLKPQHLLAYCVVCMTKKPMTNPIEHVSRGRRRYFTGTCPECKTKLTLVAGQAKPRPSRS